MGKYDNIKKEISLLIEQGTELYKDVEKDVKSKTFPKKFMNSYESWYTKSYYVIKQLAPERLDDFVSNYKSDKRKNLEYSTYLISDLLQFVGTSTWYMKIAYLIKNQVEILSSCYDKFDSKIFDLQSLLQADLFDSEIDSAKHLMQKGFLRAAGAICGVVLEKHLSKICAMREIAITKKDPTISEFNDKLKDIAYDTIEWRKMQRLGDLRNLCDHNKNREPTKEEVTELIDGVDRVLKTIF